MFSGENSRDRRDRVSALEARTDGRADLGKLRELIQRARQACMEARALTDRHREPDVES